jgi:hypothetical protein
MNQQCIERLTNHHRRPERPTKTSQDSMGLAVSRHLLVIATSVTVLCAGLLTWPVLAGEQPTLTAYTLDGGQLVVSRQGEDYLGVSVIAWGPNWAWTGLDGHSRNEQGAEVGTLTAEGRDVSVESQGVQSSVRCPFERRGLGDRVERVRMTDDRGGVTVIGFDPPCEIPSDGAARVVLAKDKLSGGAVGRLTVTVDLPGPLDWYPSESDLPDEPGLSAWYPWQATGDAGPSAVGLEDWLERPAGQHGRIVRAGDKLLYGGKPIKLWGFWQ